MLEFSRLIINNSRAFILVRVKCVELPAANYGFDRWLLIFNDRLRADDKVSLLKVKRQLSEKIAER